MTKNETIVHARQKHLHITVDGKRHDWHQQYITGAEIKKLGKVAPQDEIYLAVQKGWEPELILDNAKVNLARPEIEHFYSKVTVRMLLVNAREKQWDKKTITFEELVVLAFGKFDSNPNKVYTVTYDKGFAEKPEGSMVKGDIVFTKTKMIFNVRATDKS